MAENAHDRYAEMLSQGYDADVIREAPDLESGAEDPSLVEVQNFLKHHGYLDYEPIAQGETPEAGRLDDVTVRALTEFQRRYNVGTPGTLDGPTREFMAAPWCGVPDLVAGPSPFFSTRCAWNRRNLTYTFGNLSSDVGNEVARNAVRRAFNTWAAAGVGLSFTEVAANANPDILVEWRQAADPDRSMVGGTLAHADFPPGCTVVVNPPNGTPPQPVHFDDEEHTWADGAAANSFDIETVALHEIGHCLGVQHTNVSGSVMFPSVSSNFTLRALQPDDNAGIRALYPPSRTIQLVLDNFGYVAGGWRVERHPRFLADLTGDRRADIIGFGDAGPYVSLNNGNGTFQPIQLVFDNFGYVAGGWRVERHPRFLADLTGDGRADIIGFGDAGVYVSLSP
jgi:Matrixin/FG-GAP-like repeat/Putative peptidoglycan binding domain